MTQLAHLWDEKLTALYPDTDGESMAENTLQFEWIVTIKLGLEAAFQHREDVFVAGDLFWYPVEHHPEIRLAPDVMAVVGRPKGHRPSYMQWLENDIPPQVVFEIISPGNRAGEMKRKLVFYERYGVQEYYMYHAERNRLKIYVRQQDRLLQVPEEQTYEWQSPLLGIPLRWTAKTLELYEPDGKPFAGYKEIVAAKHRADEAEAQAAKAERYAERAINRAERAEDRADQAESRAEKLAQQLRTLGIDPDAIY